jgi:hypothetical protein
LQAAAATAAVEDGEAAACPTGWKAAIKTITSVLIPISND